MPAKVRRELTDDWLDLVVSHELVHVFQYNIAFGGDPALARGLGAIPLWVIEGMAEYLSVGRYDPLTAMWLRDAVLRDDLPTLRQLSRDPRYFPYRYGQAFWAWIAGVYGDQAVERTYRAALRQGWEQVERNFVFFVPEALPRLPFSSPPTRSSPTLPWRARPTWSLSRRGPATSTAPSVCRSPARCWSARGRVG